uniref:PABS domain-containing protein n=1 Tax=candidate division WOR-3 bacterium TaxID=2052148 RepID=A0A7C6AF23_UNCW3
MSIGPGGGLDIILGKLANFKNIYAVEINPDIRKVLYDYKDYNGDILNLPELSFKISEGRAYLSAQNRSYDLILLSLSLTNTSAKIGHPFTECYLHTVEAYIEYYCHLNPLGMVAVFCETESFLLRTLLTIIQASVRCGINISEAHKHLVVVENFLPESPYRYLIMFFANPISETKALAVSEECQKRHLHIKFLPYFEERLAVKFDNIQQMKDFVGKMRKECSLNVAPVNDEKPFFYDFGIKIPGSFIRLLLVSALCAFVLLVFLRRRHKAILISNFYFLGIGYMIIEVAIIQKFIYLFGDPSLVFGFVLCIFLIASGIGGLTSQNRDVWTKIAVLLLPLLLLGTYGLINELINYLRQASELIKFFVSGIIIFLLGYLMGKPFPLSLGAIGETNKIDIGIIYGINGLMSVCGSILAMVCARLLGFKFLFLIGFFIYLLVWLNMELSGIFQCKK